jgi:alpha-L-arabinofuranosidase
MGRLRAAHGDPQPYDVRLWEVGNETYGVWQGGYHCGDENVLRYREFASAMRAVDPSIELIATGNPYDVAQPNPALDHTHADCLWNQALLAAAAGEMDYISLHCLPSNELFLDRLTPQEAYESLLAQPNSWERVFLPELRRMTEEHTPAGHPPVRIAITEWGVLGRRGDIRPVVENYGEVPYAGVFLNMAIRCCDFVTINNATALLHGGCIRKAGGQVFYDPQYTVIQQYSRLAGGLALDCQVESPTYNVTTASDLGLPLEAVPYLDAVAVRLEQEGVDVVCLVNRQMTAPLRLELDPGGPLQSVTWQYLAHPDITARARLGDSQRFVLQLGQVEQGPDGLRLDLPPNSVHWLRCQRSQ